MERKAPSSKFLSQEDVEAALPSQTVQLLLDQNANDESHQLFTELAELFIDGRIVEWQERARWVKFEEIVEQGSYRWSKPHVASLSLHSLFELKHYLTNGSIILDLKAQTLEQLVDLLLDDLINCKSISLDCKERIRNVLMKRHRHQHQMRKMPETGNKNQTHLFCISSEKDRPQKINQNAERKGNIKKNGSYVSLSGTDDENSHSKPESLYAESTYSEILKPNYDFLRKIPTEAEASNILVGEVDFLDQPIAAFIRVNPAETFDNFTEVPIPTRFVFLLLGPKKPTVSYREVGRAMATLMSDQIFREVAYKSSEKQHILAGVEEFLNVATVLPPCEWDPTIRIEPPQKVPSQETRLAPADKELDSDEEEEQLALIREQTGLARTGILFGGLRNDLKRKIPWYFSDFRDALHVKTLASFVFLYFACLSPIITFGGLLAEATGKNIGAMESLISGFICGVGYGLFSGQPLSILGSTGPVLVLETIIFDFCTKMGWDYMSFRFWIGTWIAVTLFILVAIDASAYVCYITRFTEENFAFLIGFIFIYKAVENVLSMKDKYPMSIPEVQDCFCLNASNNFSRINISEVTQWTALNQNKCLELNGTLSENCFQSEAVPNVYLMSLVLFFGTYIISTVLKDFKDARFFPSKVRQLVSDFAVIIAIVIMTLIDYQTQIPTPKLQVPHELKPTIPDRGWIISPFKNELYSIFVAIPPALLGTILIFMDQQITAVIVNRKENKFKKSCGYHLDLFVLGILIQICSIMGLPWFVAATVLSLNHVNSLKLESECAAPGEKPQFLGVLEQRVTNIMIFTLIGLSVFLTPMLKHIPMPVLFGVFLYMGVSSLGGLQVFDRIMIIFMPNKYQPDLPFLRKVRTKRVHLFTAIQLLCLACLWAIHSISSISILFPLMLIVMVGIRKLLDYLFTQDELKALDDPMPKQSKRYRKGKGKGVIGKCGQFFLGPKLILNEKEKANPVLNGNSN